MIQVREVRLREIRLPLREPFRISSGVAHERRICLLEMEDVEGRTSWSECVAGSTPNYTSETVDIAWLSLLEWLLPRVVGEKFDSPGEVFPALHRNIRGHLMAKAAVEMAAWNLAAKKRELPLAELLGGSESEVPTGISLGIEEDPGETARKAREAVREGYRKVKLKIAPGRDLETVRTVRESVGRDAELAVDGNAAYTADDLDHLARLDDFSLLMIEQPFGAGDLLQHRKLQERISTPVCLDETVIEPDRARDMIALDAGRIVNIKPGRVGGISRSVAIHDLCAEADVPVWCGGMLETGIGRAYNVALASLPNFRLPGDLSPSRRYWERDIVSPEWTMSDGGMVAVPRDEPGLGIAVDRGRIEELTVRSATAAF